MFWQRPLPTAVNRRGAFGGKVEQGADGLWATPRNQYDSQGQAVWGLLSHYNLTGDREWLGKAYPAILAGGKMDAGARRTTKIDGPDGKRVPYYGLFPEGWGEAISENHKGEFYGKTNLLYHNFWGVMGLRLSAETAEILGHEAEAKWIRAEYEDFRQCVMEACKREFVPTAEGGYWKSAYDLDRGHEWWQIAALFPCEAMPPHDPMLDKVYAQFRSKKIEGVWPSWPYISTDWAQGHLLRNEPEEAESIFWAYIRKATPHRTWFEEFDHKTREGKGDQPHGWAAADYVLLLRNMLLAERDGKLWLCQAIPRDWLADGKELEIKNAPTEFGKVELKIQSRLTDGQIDFTVRRASPRGACTARLWLRIPDSHKLQEVRIDGGKQSFAEGFVEFPLGEKEVRITVLCERQGKQGSADK